MSYPQAFPNYHGGYSRADDGMTLRDYFAAKAMQGFAAHIGPDRTFETRAGIAYLWADAMMKARDGNS